MKTRKEKETDLVSDLQRNCKVLMGKTEFVVVEVKDKKRKPDFDKPDNLSKSVSVVVSLINVL